MAVYSFIRIFEDLAKCVFLNVEADHPPLLKMAPEPFDEEACDHFLSMARSFRNMQENRLKK